jgi:hypothetical protein
MVTPAFPGAISPREGREAFMGKKETASRKVISFF